MRGKLKPKPHVRILADNEEPSVNYLLRRGDPVGFGDPVEAGVPTVLQNAALKSYSAVSPFPGATGRRLALAKWLTQPNHPLTAACCRESTVDAPFRSRHRCKRGEFRALRNAAVAS